MLQISRNLIADEARNHQRGGAGDIRHTKRIASNERTTILDLSIKPGPTPWDQAHLGFGIGRDLLNLVGKEFKAVNAKCAERTHDQLLHSTRPHFDERLFFYGFAK
jgi:hypothetical protein